MVKQTRIGELVGLEVSSVCFVRSYVELHFDGPILRSLARPSVTLAGTRAQFPDDGSRDALCDLIGRVVDAAEDLPDRLLVSLSGGADFVIPKASADAGAEIAHFVPTVDGELDVASMAIWENLVPTRSRPETGIP
jgi:hypothetical protein